MSDEFLLPLFYNEWLFFRIFCIYLKTMCFYLGNQYLRDNLGFENTSIGCKQAFFSFFDISIDTTLMIKD